MKVKFYDLEMYGETYKVYLVKGNYSNNGTLAVEIIAVDDNGFEEPFAVLTKNMDCGCLASNMQFIDTNNLVNIGDWLVKNNIANPAGMNCSSGFCTYPLYEFTKEALAGMGEW